MREVDYETKITDELIGQIKTIKKQITNPNAKWEKQGRHLQVTYEATLYGYPGVCLTIFKRQMIENPKNFSCGIVLGGHVLARYNGTHPGTHPNLPGYKHKEVPPNTCHIHEASEQAIKAGKYSEYNAIPTKRYNDLAGAWLCLVSDHNVVGINSPN